MRMRVYKNAFDVKRADIVSSSVKWGAAYFGLRNQGVGGST